ncbi:MAG: DHH family phosphoesterase [Clostridia bacterium]|nr:DHH family phosphoesterase [Clostridia bacterium]
MSPKKHPRDIAAILHLDLRAPFAVAVMEGLLLMGLVALLSYLEVPYIAYIALGALILYLITAGVTLLAYVLHFAKIKQAQEAAEQQGTDIYRMFRTVVDIPYAVVNASGSVRVINTAMQDILGFHSPVCNIPVSEICPGITAESLAASVQDAFSDSIGARMAERMTPEHFPAAVQSGGDNAPIVRLSNGRRYRVDRYLLHRESEHYYFLVFRDVEDHLTLIDENNRDHMVMAYIMLDNLQELTQFVRANYRATANLIEEALTKWIEGMNGMLREYDRDKYLAIFTSEALDRCIEDDFSILDEIMNIHVGDNSFPLSVSMGIADIDGTMADRERAANAALDMALQRGGNQVALQRRGINGLTYFGGAHKTLESNTSISSRVSAHLLEKQLSDCDRVLIMAHSNPDFDAIGSTVGAYRLCRSILEKQGKKQIPVHIVTDKRCDTFAICASHLSTLPEYRSVFIDKASAQQTVTTGTVLILTDVNNPYIFEAPQLVGCIAAKNGVSNIAVIDHHRLVNELPFTPCLHYIEATKSSASEIIAEILQQSDYADTLLKEEANLLLAGIMLDTHNFTRSAGAQTFEITYYLYSRNAHTDVVRDFFSSPIDEFLVAGDFDAHTHVYKDSFAITWLSEDHVPTGGDRIAAAKAADKLLTLRGVEASFALALVPGGVAISARSKGKINVQLIMEKLDGGGHFDMAGAQVPGDVSEAYDRLTAAIDEYRLQFPEQFKAE